MKALKENKNVEIVKDDVWPKSFIIDEYFKRFPVLTQSLKSFNYLNDNVFIWNIIVDGQTIPAGEFHWIEIENAVKYEQNYIQHFQNIAFKAELNHVYLIEDHPVSGDGLLVFVITFKSSNRTEIWMLDRNGNPLKLKLNFEEYFNKSLDNFAIFNWQYLYVDSQYLHHLDEVILNDLKNLINRINAAGIPNQLSESYKNLLSNWTNFKNNVS